MMQDMQEATTMASEIDTFLQECQTILIASVDENAVVNASYSPFIRMDSNIYIMVSHVAAHTKNLMDMPHVSVMAIEDEAKAKQLYARKRLTLDVHAVLVNRDEGDEWERAAQKLKERFGAIIETLTQMADFVIFRLEPKNGLFVKGFGKAYAFNGMETEKVQHVKKPHRALSDKVANTLEKMGRE